LNTPQTAIDTVNWAQLGGDGTLLSQTFVATSGLGLGISGAFNGATGGLTSVVCDPVTPVNCSWGPAATGYPIGSTVIWAEGTDFTGTSPITISTSATRFGFGAYIQATSIGQFSATLQAFNGASSLGAAHTFTSDASGNPLFMGALSDTQNINKIVLTLTACGSFGCDPNDFSMNTLQIYGAASSVPEPSTFPLVSGGLLALGYVFRKRTRR
jgi:hypothetical protein